MSNQPWNSDTREKAMMYLTRGVKAEQCAEALGVSPSLISQLMQEEDFAQKLAAAKFSLSHKHIRHDDQLDDTEAKLIERARELLPMITRPLELIRAASMINGMKRRGAGSVDDKSANPVVVNLSLPVAIMSRFTLNAHNQVIAAGDQELVTIQSNKVADLVATKIPSQSRENQYAHNSLPTADPSAEANRRLSIEDRSGAEKIQESRVKYERIDEFGFDYQNQSL